MTTLTIPSFLSGGPLSGTDETQVATLLNFVINPPRLTARATSAQSIPNGAWTAVLYDTEEIDSFNGHSTSVNTSRYTPTQSGWYRITGQCNIAGNATGIRAIAIMQNGTAANKYGKQFSAAGSVAIDCEQCTTTDLYLNGTTDYVEVVVIQTSGGALNTVVGGDGGAPGGNPRFSAHFIGSSAT